MNGRVLEAIEQNREKPGRWGKLARERHQVVQFRDVETHKLCCGIGGWGSAGVWEVPVGPCDRTRPAGSCDRLHGFLGMVRVEFVLARKKTG